MQQGKVATDPLRSNAPLDTLHMWETLCNGLLFNVFCQNEALETCFIEAFELKLDEEN